MTNPGAGANEISVAPAPEKMLGSTAPGSVSPALVLRVDFEIDFSTELSWPYAAPHYGFVKPDTVSINID